MQDEITQDRLAAEASELADHLEPGWDHKLRGLFVEHGSRAPILTWSPSATEMRQPLLTAFGNKLRALADDGGRIPAAAVDPGDFGALADWMMLVEADGPTGPFRYLHYGRRIADHYGRDMNGLTTADFQAPIAQFFTALYIAAARRGDWVLSEHEPPGDAFVRQWRRLLVPLCGARGQVTRFAVLNIAENELRAGLDLIVDPVFVLNDAHIIQYSNAAARRFFTISPEAIAPATLHDVTGIAIDPGRSAAALQASGDTVDTIELCTRGAIVERLAMTVSAEDLRGRAYYVVVMRLIGS